MKRSPSAPTPSPGADLLLDHRRMLACLDTLLTRLDAPLREVSDGRGAGGGVAARPATWVVGSVGGPSAANRGDP